MAASSGGRWLVEPKTDDVVIFVGDEARGRLGDKFKGTFQELERYAKELEQAAGDMKPEIFCSDVHVGNCAVYMSCTGISG